MSRGVREKETHYGGFTNSSDLLENCYLGVFGFADYRSLFRLKKIQNGGSNMAVEVYKN